MMAGRIFNNRTKVWALWAILLNFSFIPNAAPQSDFDVLAEWRHLPHSNKNLYQQFLAEAEMHRDARDQKLTSIKSKEEWTDRQKWVKKKLRELVGSFPEKTPLRPKITGKIVHLKYTIEKLHFQSRPDFYVSAALFIPKNTSLPAPAILFCSGHTSEGFRSATYQHMILNYVQKGFIVLAFDPVGQGERSQYLDANGTPYLSPTHDHSFAGNQVFLNGTSPANYFIWDGIRALDYLESRPEVDANRIGVTGRSGGGTQTAYLMAFDDRVQAAAPECYLTTFDKLLKSRGPQDAEQNIMHFLDGLDLADLVEVRAPKPTLMVTTTRDIFSIAGARDLYREAMEVYQVFEAEDNLQMVEDDAPHASTKKNREATYAFFQLHLDHPGPGKDEPVDTLPVEELWVTPSGQVSRDLGSKSIFELNSLVSQQIAENRGDPLLDLNILKELSQNLSSLINYDASVFLKEIIYVGKVNFEKYSIEKYLIELSTRYFLPVVRLRPTNDKGQVVLLLDEHGKSNQSDSASLARTLVEAGHQVFLTDLSGIGELGGFTGGDASLQGVPINEWYAGVLTNKSSVAIRVREITLLCEFISNLTNGQQINLVSMGTIGADALHAAALGLTLSSMTLVDHLVSYQSILQTEKYHPKFILSAVAGSNTLYDLPELSYYAPDDFQLINPVDARGKKVELIDVKNYLAHRSSRSQFHIGLTPAELIRNVLEILR